MALLVNDTGALRLRLELVQREGGRPGAPARAGAGGRVLTVAAVEQLDRTDGQHWPIVRVPPLRIEAEAAAALVDGVRAVTAGELPGVAWQSGPDGAVGVQLAADPEVAGRLLVEIGLDLSAWLGELAGTPVRPGAELALFRFLTGQAPLVSFGGALRQELEALGG